MKDAVCILSVAFAMLLCSIVCQTTAPASAVNVAVEGMSPKDVFALVELARHPNSTPEQAYAFAVQCMGVRGR